MLFYFSLLNINISTRNGFWMSLNSIDGMKGTVITMKSNPFHSNYFHSCFCAAFDPLPFEGDRPGWRRWLRGLWWQTAPSACRSKACNHGPQLRPLLLWNCIVLQNRPAMSRKVGCQWGRERLLRSEKLSCWTIMNHWFRQIFCN